MLQQINIMQNEQQALKKQLENVFNESKNSSQLQHLSRLAQDIQDIKRMENQSQIALFNNGF